MSETPPIIRWWTCFWGHRWAQWVQSDVKNNFAGGVIYTVDLRHCMACNKHQIRGIS